MTNRRRVFQLQVKFAVLPPPTTKDTQIRRGILLKLTVEDAIQSQKARMFHEAKSILRHDIITLT
jgi:hypothetical protein